MKFVISCLNFYLIGKSINWWIEEIHNSMQVRKWKISFQKCGDTINHSAIYHLLFCWINSKMKPNFIPFFFIFYRIYTMVYLKCWQTFDTMFWWIFKFISSNLAQNFHTFWEKLFHIDKSRNFYPQYGKSIIICVYIKI